MIFAPLGRDAQLAVQLLEQLGIAGAICRDLPSLSDAMSANTTFVVVAEEAMRFADLRVLQVWVEAQPAWSDLPFIVLTQRGGGPESNPAALHLTNVLGNVSFLERPFHPTTFASMAHTALKARLRQFDARARLEELNQSEDRLATALQAGKLGDWEYTPETGALTTSALFRACYGRSADSIFTYDDLIASVHPEDRQRVERAIAGILESLADYNIEYRVIWPDRSVHWVQVNARIVTAYSSKVRQMVGVIADITDRKQAEDNLRLMNESLERRVAERTSELERSHARILAEAQQRQQVEEQLRQVQKLEMIGQLTGGVAHDFNNLLMAVLANLELLRKHIPEDPKSLRLIDGALKGAERGAALTQRLLAFARRQSLTIEAADVSALVLGMRDLIERSIGPNIELRFDVQQAPRMSMIDSNQVELALLNLAVNARDAMPDGGVLTIAIDTVDAAGASDLAPGQYIRLSVSDTGIGMDAETLQRAIEPFFSTKELGKGTGLGLSMVHGLAVQLNGVLRLTSAPGSGTRAELLVPATANVPVKVETAVAEPNFAIPGRAKILLVDDDVLIAMSTVDMLEDLGHEVIEANSGPAALAALKQHGPVDLIITDFSMPGMTGLQFAEAALEMKPQQPILLATGYAEIPSGSKIDLPRISKPYSQAQLAHEIGRLLSSDAGIRA